MAPARFLALAALFALAPGSVVPARAEGGLIMDRLRADGAQVTSLGRSAGMDGYLVRNPPRGILPDRTVIYLFPGGAKAVAGSAFEVCGREMRNVTAMQMLEQASGVTPRECPRAASGFLDYLREMGALIEPVAALDGLPGYVARSAKGDKALLYLALDGKQIVTGTVIDASGVVLAPPWEIGSSP